MGEKSVVYEILFGVIRSRKTYANVCAKVEYT